MFSTNPSKCVFSIGCAAIISHRFVKGDADDDDATSKYLSLWLQEYGYAADGRKGSEGDAGNVAARDGAVASDYLD
jgi:hypothetical protein